MRNQIQTTERLPLLNGKGQLLRPSWAAEDVFVYNKEQIRRPWRRKEWEFYQLSNSRFVFRITYGHAVYAGQVEAVLLDMESGRRIAAGSRRPFPGDELDMDFSPGEPHRLKFEHDDFFLSVDFDGVYRRIRCRSEELDAELMFPDEGDAVMTAAPFKRRGQFCCLYKKNFLDVRGRICAREVEYPLGDDSFISLSSMRGCCPPEHNWVWGCGSTRIDGHLLSISIGWGNGSIRYATENAIFWDGEIQKLSRVRERCDYSDFMHPSRIADEDGRLSACFTPYYHSSWDKSFLLARCRSHQTYGTLEGYAVLDDGTRLSLDGMQFFCEHVRCRW